MVTQAGQELGTGTSPATSLLPSYSDFDIQIFNHRSRFCLIELLGADTIELLDFSNFVSLRVTTASVRFI